MPQPQAGGKGALKFEGVMPYPPLNKVDDWGLTVEEQEAKVEQFRQILDAKGLWRREDNDYYMVLRFLRARNYDYEKALKMWTDSANWRSENRVDTILEEFTFHEREQFLMAYPQGYHKTDRLGRPVYIQLLGKIDINTLKQITSEERMIKFHIQEYERCRKQIMPICSKLQDRQIDQTFGIMDVKGVGMSHLTGEVKRLMATITKYDQDNYPEMLGRICIINAPLVFKALWGLVKPMLNPRTISKIQICQGNYSKDLLEWVAPENLPIWLGGQSKGTLLDDVGPWSDPEVLRRLDGEGSAIAHKMLKQLTVDVKADGPGELLLGDDGFATPKSEGSFYSVGSGVLPDTSVPLLASTGAAGAGAGAAAAAAAGVAAAASAGGSGGGASAHDAAEGRRRPSHQQDAAHPSGRGEAGPHAGGLGIGPYTSDRTKSLSERIASLEAVYAQQMQRLKGYMPASSLEKLQERNAPEGTLLQRIETLEEGLEVLLKAQDLQWQQDEAGKARNRCCSGGCVIC